MPHQAELPPGPRVPHSSGIAPSGLPVGQMMMHPADVARMAAAQLPRVAPNHMSMYAPPRGVRLPHHPGHVIWRNPLYEPQYGLGSRIERGHAQRQQASRPDAAQGSAAEGIRRVPVSLNEEAGMSAVDQRRKNSVVDEREAASALLMAAGGKLTAERPFTAPESEDSPASPVLQRNEPLKKRKVQTDTSSFPSGDTPCHVSPISNSSVGTAGHGLQEDMPSRTPGIASRTDSFDLKEGQALNESSKIGDTAEIAPPTPQMEVPHFPSILHAVLTNNVDNIVKWTEDGQAWRIVRWDALRREILPKYFPEFNEETGRGSVGSIDAFLCHARAWGFEEIKDGPNVGAYQHKLFLRGSHNLCQQMSLSTIEGDADSPKTPTGSHAPIPGSSEKPGSHNKSKSILQVPSLASSRSDGTNDTKVSVHYGHYGSASTPMGQAPAPHASGSPYHPWSHPGRVDPAIPVSYRSDEGRFGDSPRMMRSVVMFPPTYDPRFPFRQHGPEVPSRPPHPSYAAPRVVRSGRGGARMAMLARPQPSMEEPCLLKRDESCPVSQRGKGARGRSASSGASVASVTSESAAPVAVPRKAKRRKLPLSRHNET